MQQIPGDCSIDAVVIESTGSGRYPLDSDVVEVSQTNHYQLVCISLYHTGVTGHTFESLC